MSATAPVGTDDPAVALFHAVVDTYADEEPGSETGGISMFTAVAVVSIALGVGVTQRQIDCIEQGSYEDAAFNAAEQALLAFGREVIENVRVAAPVFATMRAHFSEQEIVESILAIGFYMTMARLTEATEVDLDPAAGMTVFDGGKKRSG